MRLILVEDQSDVVRLSYHRLQDVPPWDVTCAPTMAAAVKPTAAFEIIRDLNLTNMSRHALGARPRSDTGGAATRSIALNENPLGHDHAGAAALDACSRPMIFAAVTGG